MRPAAFFRPLRRAKSPVRSCRNVRAKFINRLNQRLTEIMETAAFVLFCPGQSSRVESTWYTFFFQYQVRP